MGFGNVSSQIVNPDKTVDLEINQLVVLDKHPVFVVRHLGESNADFWSEIILRAGSKTASKIGRGGALDTAKDDEAERTRVDRQNRSDVARFAIVSHRGFFHDMDDRPGVPDPDRPATSDDTADIVNALPADVFRALLVFVINPDNFRDRPVSLVSPSEVAKK